MADTVVAKAPHVITIGTTKVGVVLPDQYGELSTILGVDKIAGTNKPDLSSTTSELMKSGQAIRIRISFAISNKRKTADLLCSIDKARTAVTELVGKGFRGTTIKTAYFARRARYH